MFLANEIYPATVVDAGVTKEEGKEPQAFIQFKLTNETGGSMNLTWFGGFNQAVAEGKKMSQADVTAKNLVSAGFTGSDVDELAKNGKLMFNTVEGLTVKLEHTKDKAGFDTDKLRIKYINGVSKKREAFKGATPKLAGVFAKAKQELGIKTGW